MCAAADDISGAIAKRRALEGFIEELDKEEESDIDLVRCSLRIAQCNNPEIDIDATVQVLDSFGEELERSLPPELADLEARSCYPLKTVKAINAYMYDALGFVGNEDSFYDPRNSFMDEVLERRTGIPLTLSLVYQEVARRIGFELLHVHLPARFYLRPALEGVEFLIDCFKDGEVVFVEDVEELLAKGFGEDARVKVDRDQLWGDRTQRPTRFLSRMLTNLKQIYWNDDALAEALLLTEYQDAVCAAAGDDEKVRRANGRDRSLLLFKLERFAEARDGFVAYLESGGDEEPDAQVVWQLIARAEDALARLNRLAEEYED